MPNPKGQNVRRVLRQNTALALRIMGKSYRNIAIECGGVDVSTAYSDVQDALASLDNITRDRAEECRAVELLRLDALTVCLGPKIDSGDTKAILVALRIMERRVRLLGLDAVPAPEVVAPMKFTLDFGTTLGEDGPTEND